MLRQSVRRLRSLAKHVFRKKEERIMSRNPLYAAHDIGEWTYGWPKILTFSTGARLKIGNYCSIAHGATILLGGEHQVDWVTTYPFPAFFPNAPSGEPWSGNKGDVVIGHDVWIGQDAFILSGVTIHSGAIVGARAVVTRDVEPYSIVAGNPARHIRYRFREEIRESLLKIAWWEWPDESLRAAWPMLLSRNVEEFVEKYRSAPPR
jgi:acetyltransferase-like isoleucine patch superfamily enzyme